MRALYRLVAAGIFIAELAIAMGAGGPFVRGSVGDVLAVALIYFSLRAFSPASAAAIAVATGFVVEGFQFLHVAERLELSPGGALYTLVGNTFSLADLSMYVLGGGMAFVVDRFVLVPRLHPISGGVASGSP